MTRKRSQRRHFGTPRPMTLEEDRLLYDYIGTQQQLDMYLEILMETPVNRIIDMNRINDVLTRIERIVNPINDFKRRRMVRIPQGIQKLPPQKMIVPSVIYYRDILSTLGQLKVSICNHVTFIDHILNSVAIISPGTIQVLLRNIQEMMITINNIILSLPRFEIHELARSQPPTTYRLINMINSFRALLGERTAARNNLRRVLETRLGIAPQTPVRPGPVQRSPPSSHFSDLSFRGLFDEDD